MKAPSFFLHNPTAGRGGTWFVVVLLVLGTFCKRADIIDHFGGGLLTVSPVQITDSAIVGDTQPRTTILHLQNQGGGQLHWRASLINAANWLSFQPDSGVAGLDSIVVQARPSGLSSGVYRDTLVILVAAPSVSGGVSIELRVRP